MKRILTIIFAAIAIAACGPDEEVRFNEEAIAGTQWEGTFQKVQNNLAKEVNDIKITFGDGGAGSVTLKKNGGFKVTNDIRWEADDKTISFEAPEIAGKWTVKGYNGKTMSLSSSVGYMTLGIL